MNRIGIPLIFLTLLSMAAFPAAAQRTEYSANDVQRRVENVLTTYDWHHSIEDLSSAAQDKNRMMLWIQIVGDLDGGL